MFDFLGTFYGAVSLAIICATMLIICATALIAVFRLADKDGGVEIDNGKQKVKIGTTQIEKCKTSRHLVISADDWKRFSDDLYEFCVALMQPAESHRYGILHCFDSSMSDSKKMYVERFLYFNHIPEKSDKKYGEYVSAHTDAIVRSVCRDMKYITCEYDKVIPDFDASELKKKLSVIIEKYRN